MDKLQDLAASKPQDCMLIFLKALTLIEDYFEYRSMSKRDKLLVYNVLEQMNQELTELNEFCCDK